ncbi:MAG: BsuBI/PstI family type II restriction endonuclease [Candidatus Binataceae bacterium]
MNKTLKLREAQIILRTLGLPTPQQNQISALTLLALCGLTIKDPWSTAQREARTITNGIMDFARRGYRANYAPNTRETVRRQVLHQFVLAGIADYNPFDPDLPTNSPRAHYSVSELALTAIGKFGTPEWEIAVRRFFKNRQPLIEIFSRERTARLIPVKLPDGSSLNLSPGRHNAVQRAVVERFVPRFAPGSRLLYLGDTAQKYLHIDADRLAQLHLPITEHDKLPDIILFDEKRAWLFLIEAVTSHGPMSPKRVLELEKVLAHSTVGAVYVSAFPDIAQFRRHLRNIAWETEVWIVEMPDHLVHYNGDRFLGPRERLHI